MDDLLNLIKALAPRFKAVDAKTGEDETVGELTRITNDLFELPEEPLPEDFWNI